MKGPNLQKLFDSFTEEEKTAVQSGAAEIILQQCTLQEIRQAVGMTQTELAEALQTGQVNISKLESRKDSKISTLKEYLAALGGKLTIVVEFEGRPPMILHGLGEVGSISASPLKISP